MVAKANGTVFNLKRQPQGPKAGHFVSCKGNAPQTIAPIAYEALV